jgi:serine/threonine protein kinase
MLFTSIAHVAWYREDALNEIRILASIKHRNIIRYCDAFTEKDNLYIVMEFAEHGDIGRQVRMLLCALITPGVTPPPQTHPVVGCSQPLCVCDARLLSGISSTEISAMPSAQIEKFKKANKYIKEDTIWSYAIQITIALQEMHDRNILHRDIKPKNIFLTGKNHVRLGDLGCAKLMKGGLARTQIGTPYYMSPEIWSNKPYDQRSDMWALGCLLYELTMLAPPFLANDMNGLSHKVKTAPAPRVSKHYSEDLANLVAALLSELMPWPGRLG